MRSITGHAAIRQLTPNWNMDINYNWCII